MVNDNGKLKVPADSQGFRQVTDGLVELAQLLKSKTDRPVFFAIGGVSTNWSMGNEELDIAMANIIRALRNVGVIAYRGIEAWFFLCRSRYLKHKNEADISCKEALLRVGEELWLQKMVAFSSFDNASLQTLRDMKNPLFHPDRHWSSANVVSDADALSYRSKFDPDCVFGVAPPREFSTDSFNRTVSKGSYAVLESGGWCPAYTKQVHPELVTDYQRGHLSVRKHEDQIIGPGAPIPVPH